MVEKCDVPRIKDDTSLGIDDNQRKTLALVMCITDALVEIW